MLSLAVWRPSTRRAALAQVPDGAELGCEAARPRRWPRPAARRPARRAARRRRRAALLDLAQPVVQRVDQQLRGASGCRAGRLRGTGCAAPPRCRPAPRTACAPSGRCGARSRSWSRIVPGALRRAAASRSRGRRTRCSCRESRAGAVRVRSGVAVGGGHRRRLQGSGAFIGLVVDANPAACRGLAAGRRYRRRGTVVPRRVIPRCPPAPFRDRTRSCHEGRPHWPVAGSCTSDGDCMKFKLSRPGARRSRPCSRCRRRPRPRSSGGTR